MMEAQDDDAGDAEAVRAFQGRMADIVARAVAAERDACAAKAREFSEHYEQGSDGRNTFVLLAEWIEARSTLSK